MNIFAQAARLEEENKPFALAQIIESRGSTPRHSGQMLVLADGSIVGTIGGGMVERLVIDQALEALSERKARVSMDAWRVTAKMPLVLTAVGLCRFTLTCMVYALA